MDTEAKPTYRHVASWLTRMAFLLVAIGGIPSSSVADCTTCVKGICYDNPPGATAMGSIKLKMTYYAWKANGNGTVSLKIVGTYARKVVLRTCSGRLMAVSQIVYHKVEDAGLPPVPLASVASVDPDLPTPPGQTPDVGVNGPSTGGPWPPVWPPRPVNWNCHAQALGLGPGTACPQPPKPAPPADGEPPGPSTGDGFWVDHPERAYQTPCWWDCYVCAIPPPQGAVLVWYEAPVAGGSPDYSKATATHSATSNGDGSYTSKNGATGERTQETQTHLEKTYGAPGSQRGGNVVFVQIKMKDC